MTVIDKYSAQEWTNKIQNDFAFAMPNREQIGTIQQATDLFREFAVNLTRVYPGEVLNLVIPKIVEAMYIGNSGLYKAYGTTGANAQTGDTDYTKKVG